MLFVVWRLERRVLPLIRDSAGPAPRAPVRMFPALVLLLAGRYVLSPLENQSHDLVVFLCVVLANEVLDAMLFGLAALPAILLGLYCGLFLSRLLPDRVLRSASVAVLILIATSAILSPYLPRR